MLDDRFKIHQRIKLSIELKNWDDLIPLLEDKTHEVDRLFIILQMEMQMKAHLKALIIGLDLSEKEVKHIRKKILDMHRERGYWVNGDPLTLSIRERICKCIDGLKLSIYKWKDTWC